MGGLVSQCSVDTNVLISEIDTVSITIDIQGALNNDLSDSTQGLCRVCINFEHEFLGDLRAELISPQGSGYSYLVRLAILDLLNFQNGMYVLCLLGLRQCQIQDLPTDGRIISFGEALLALILEVIIPFSVIWKI